MLSNAKSAAAAAPKLTIAGLVLWHWYTWLLQLLISHAVTTHLSFLLVAVLLYFMSR